MVLVRVRLPRWWSLPTVLAAVIAGALPGQASAASPAGSGTPTWQVVSTLTDTATIYDMFGITAAGPRDAWAFGRAASNEFQDVSPVLRHWNGQAWRTLAVPPAFPANWGVVAPIASGSSSPQNMWAFDVGDWAHWNGKRWAVGTLPVPSGDLVSVNVASTAVLSPSDVWVTGDLTGASIIPYLAHFDGHRWKILPVSAESAEMVAVSASGPDDVWVAGDAATNVMSQWNGHRWQQVHMPPEMAGPSAFGGLVVFSAKDVWVTGLLPASSGGGFTGGAWHWDGHRWHQLSFSTRCELAHAARDGHGGLWAAFESCNPGRLWHESAGTWTSAPMPDDGVSAYVEQLTAVPGTSVMLATGVAYPHKKLSGVILQRGHLP